MLVDIKDSNEAYYIKELEVVVQINKLMREVIEIGTANKVFFKGYGLSGKTGTSKDENGKQNGLFIGFTTDKSYAIIVNLYENIGSTAAMIASDVLYLSNNL
jgi:cell division protein FtsI/penicillin-binding protein 2